MVIGGVGVEIEIDKSNRDVEIQVGEMAGGTLVFWKDLKGNRTSFPVQQRDAATSIPIIQQYVCISDIVQ